MPVTDPALRSDLAKTAGAGLVGYDGAQSTVKAALDTLATGVSNNATAASTAQSTANTANSTANAALPKSGGTMTGGITMPYGTGISGTPVVGSVFSMIGINSWDGGSQSLAVNGQGTLQGPLLLNMSAGRNVRITSGITTNIADFTAAGMTLLGGSVRINAIADQDDLGGNSATWLATQQSIKAYVDNTVLEREVATASASDVAVVDIQIPAGAKKVIIDYENLVPTIDGASLNARTSSDAGSTFDSGASDYSHGHFRNLTSSATGGVTSADSKIPLSAGVGSDTNENGVSGRIVVVRPDQTEYTQIYFDDSGVGISDEDMIYIGSGRRRSSTDVDHIRLYFNSGNIESGELQVAVI